MGTIICGFTTAALIIFSSQISSLFFVSSSDGWFMTRQMIRLQYLFLIPNLIFNIFLKSYQAQGKTMFMNIIVFVEVASVGLFTFATVPIFGTNAAWISNAVMDVVMICIVLISAIIYNRRFDLSLPAILKLSDDFGASEDEYREVSIKDFQDISEVSEQTIDFCRSKNYPKKTAFFIGLCIEEMASNVLKHGRKSKNRYYTDVRVVVRDELTVRIRDNCHEFDPRHRQDMYYPDTPEKYIGIRLTSKLAKQIDYYNNAGINTLLMKF
jgi:anti-sigma regulatory factor (Ser/Thr protein kinase)